MAVLLWLSVIIISYMLGKGALNVLYGRRQCAGFHTGDAVLTGWMLCMGTAEAAHLGAVLAGWSFTLCKRCFLLGILALSVLLLSVYALGRMRERKKGTCPSLVRSGVSGTGVSGGFWNVKNVAAAIFGLMVLLQLMTIVLGRSVYLEGDLTVETVNSILDSDTLYQVNPMTGRPYTGGIPFRLEILCLPTLYAILSDVSGLAPYRLVWSLVPAVVLLYSYLAYGTVAGALFPESAEKRRVFLLGVAVVLQIGDYMYGMDGFGLLHSGFRGVSIRAAVLVPYAFGLVLRRRWKLVVLCILAEACMVWTTYGLGVCFLITAVMIMCRMFPRLAAQWKAGKEGAWGS